MPTDKGANAGLKVASLVGGMVAGADSIDDMALLRHGGMGRIFARAYAPSTLGSFLRAFTFGHVRQLDAVASRFLLALAGLTRLLGTGRAAARRRGDAGYALLDVDDTIIEVHGHAKQGAGFGYTGVRGLNALLATLTTDDGGAGDRGAAAAQGRLRVAARREAAGRRRGEDGPTAARPGPSGPGADGLGVLRPRRRPRRAGRRRRGVGHGADGPAVKAAIAAIERGRVDHDRVHRRGLRRDHRRWISRAEVAEVAFTAFAARRRPTGCPAGWWCAGSRTSTPTRRRPPARTPCSTCGASTRSSPPPTPRSLDTVAADKTHRGHAIIEQVHADLKNSALAHLPPGCSPRTPPGWCSRSSRSTSPAPPAASTAPELAKATTATIRRKLIAVPARVATSARRITLHLPTRGPGRRLDHAVRPGRRPTATPSRPDHQQQGCATRGTPVEHPDSEVRQINTPRPPPGSRRDDQL